MDKLIEHKVFHAFGVVSMKFCSDLNLFLKTPSVQFRTLHIPYLQTFA